MLTHQHVPVDDIGVGCVQVLDKSNLEVWSNFATNVA